MDTPWTIFIRRFFVLLRYIYLLNGLSTDTYFTSHVLLPELQTNGDDGPHLHFSGASFPFI